MFEHTDELSQTISGVLKLPFNMMFGSATSLQISFDTDSWSLLMTSGSSEGSGVL